jgi:hypothetical protein
MNKSNIHETLQAVYNGARETGFVGSDPFDGLNSRFVYPIVKRSKVLRLALLQFNKLSPFNFRKVLGNSGGVNPKALALFLSGVSYHKGIYQSDAVSELVNLIDEHSLKSGLGLGWGYNFDWQNRAFFIPKNTPTVVNTSFVIHSLIDAYEATGNEKCLSLAKRSIPFYTKDLNIDYSVDGTCFSYTPIDNTKVHNANLLAAGALARLSKYFQSPDVTELINLCVDYGINGQSSEGSWIYGSHKSQNWVDSFHTAFNLEALNHISDSGLYFRKLKLEESITLGHQYYLNNFFGPLGQPNYFNNAKYPYDIHTSAQAISYLSHSTDKESQEILEKVVSWTMKNMYEGHFLYRKNRFYTNKINYLRWSQAWMFYGLSKLMRS